MNLMKFEHRKPIVRTKIKDILKKHREEIIHRLKIY